MASRVARIYGGKPCVTVYEFDEAAFGGRDIRVRKFELPTKEWALFVIHNRSRELMEYITQDIIAFLVEDRQIDIAEAVKVFHNSETDEKLLDEETGLYLEGTSFEMVGDFSARTPILETSNRIPRIRFEAVISELVLGILRSYMKKEILNKGIGGHGSIGPIRKQDIKFTLNQF